MTLPERRAPKASIGLVPLWRRFVLALLLMGSLLPAARAQDAAFKNEELDQMLAPIALYPDSLLSQILMASTYPADVAEAAEWSKAHPDTKGDAAVQQVQDRAWEASVQSLVAFPQVLAMMRERPGDVQRLGDAFLADPGRVMDRVQVLRGQAKAAGNLNSNPQQTVSVQTEASKQVIVIQPAQPQTVYVPVYQPTVVYGSWAYPGYPPYYWAPPPYYYPPSSGAFVAGVFWGAAVVGISNSLWGGFNWGRNDVNINVNRYNNINVNKKISNTNNTFVHNADRRGDVPYRDSKSREQYGKKQAEGAKDREAFRGKDGGAQTAKAPARDGRDADRAKATEALKDRGVDPAAGREKLQGVDRDKAEAAVAGRDRQPGRDGDRAGAGGRDADRTADRSGDRAGRAGNSAGTGALAGVQNSAASRADADRGRASSAAMNQRPSGGARPAPAARPSPAARPAPSGRAGGGGRR
jgi:Protein of unknown function (DUF3300)